MKKQPAKKLVKKPSSMMPPPIPNRPLGKTAGKEGMRQARWSMLDAGMKPSPKAYSGNSIGEEAKRQADRQKLEMELRKKKKK